MQCCLRSFLRAALLTAVGAAAALSVASCSRTEEAKPEPAPASSAAEAQPTGPVQWVKAPGDVDVAAFVRGEVVKAKAENRRLIVYVGAGWCDPCERFHHAAEAGELNAALPGLRFVAFDLDRDREALDHAGYGSRMIPLFVVPRDDGSPSSARMEGGIKGEAAAAELTGRLTRLLAKARSGA